MKLKTLLLTILISTSLIGTASALTFTNSNSNNNSSKSAQSINAFDGEYPFELSRFNPSDGPMVLGSGILVIENGTISVSPKHRFLNTSSTKYYDTLKGRINKKGKIKVKFKVNALTGKGKPRKVSFSGNINNLQIKGKFDDYFEMIIAFIDDEIKKSMDDDGIFQFKGFHALNAPHAINPVSVSDFSIIGKTSLRFESNDGECGQEPNHSDCDTDRERVELYYGDESWKTEKWYRFYLYLPKDYNSVAPAKMSLIQWRSMEPSLMLVTFQHMHAGLIFQRNADAFVESDIVLKSNEDLLGNWTEIIFNTNWHPDPEKGFMKVWIDGKLKVDINATAHYKKGGKLNLRYGFYSSYMSYYKNTFNTNKMPQRIAFYDGVKAEKNCQKLLDLSTCENLVSQNVKEYKLFLHNSIDKELHSKSICEITSARFETVTNIDDFYNPYICRFP